MAYQTGTVATKAQFFSELASFLQTNGWTNFQTWAEMTGTTSDTAVTTGYTLAAITDPTGNMFTFAYSETDSNIYMNYATAVLTGRRINYQTGANPNLRNFWVTRCFFPLVAYYFFYDGAMCHVVLETSTNIFTHMHFGMVTKNGTWGGGKLVTGSHYTNLNYGFADAYRDNFFDFQTPRSNGSWDYARDVGFMSCTVGASGVADIGWSQRSNLTVAAPMLITDGNMGWRMVEEKPNLYNGRAPMIPITLFLSSSLNGGAPMYPIGHVPNMAVLNITYLEPKTLVNGDWLVFPFAQKNGNGTLTVNTGVYGFAYRK